MSQAEYDAVFTGIVDESFTRGDECMMEDHVFNFLLAEHGMSA